MSKIRDVCTFLLWLLFCNCGGGADIAERISSAEMAYTAGDVASLRHICDDIMRKNAEKGNLTAGQLGRMSILYMELYDCADDAEALDMAIQCYRSAYEENADSAACFYAHLPVEQYKYGMSLTMLVQSADNPADISDIEQSDSNEEETSAVRIMESDSDDVR